MFFGCFWVNDFVHHWGGEVALAVQVEPCQEWDDLVEHGKDDTKCKGGEEDITQGVNGFTLCEVRTHGQEHTEYECREA